jgi:hypothetical protein
MSNKPLPRIPLEVFRKMLETLSLEDLRQLPAGKLPREVPTEVLRGIEGERREILDDLLFEANSHHVNERLALEAIFGPDLIPALDQAKILPEKAVKDSLQRNIESFAELAGRWLKNQDQYSREAIDRAIVDLDGEIKRAFSEKLNLRSYQAMLRDGFHLAGEYQDDFKEALKSMEAQESAFDDWVARYYDARLSLVAYALNDAYQDVEAKNKRLKTIHWEIKEIKKRIQSSSEAMGLKGSAANHNHFIQELHSELQMMEGMKPDFDVIIPEANLTKWLDVVIDAYLCPVDSGALIDPLKQAREALFKLVLIYCDVQSNAAEKISEQEFSVLDKEKNIQYMLETERFIQKYFKNKDIDVKSWGVGEKYLEMLEQFEQDLLSAIREATHFE